MPFAWLYENEARSAYDPFDIDRSNAIETAYLRDAETECLLDWQETRFVVSFAAMTVRRAFVRPATFGGASAPPKSWRLRRMPVPLASWEVWKAPDADAPASQSEGCWVAHPLYVASAIEEAYARFAAAPGVAANAVTTLTIRSKSLQVNFAMMAQTDRGATGVTKRVRRRSPPDGSAWPPLVAWFFRSRRGHLYPMDALSAWAVEAQFAASPLRSGVRLTILRGEYSYDFAAQPMTQRSVRDGADPMFGGAVTTATSSPSTIGVSASNTTDSVGAGGAAGLEREIVRWVGPLPVWESVALPAEGRVGAAGRGGAAAGAAAAAPAAVPAGVAVEMETLYASSGGATCTLTIDYRRFEVSFDSMEIVDPKNARKSRRRLTRSTAPPLPDAAGGSGSAEAAGAAAGDAAFPPSQLCAAGPSSWALGERLGRGGFGEVFKATELATNRVFAVKRIDVQPNDTHEAQLAALRSEMRLMQRLVHPHLVRYLGFHADIAALHILMEYIDGGTLQALVRPGLPRLPPAQLRTFVGEILLGVEFLHRSRVVHRDLKPANILLATDPAVVGGRVIKIADFGTAKQLNTMATTSTHAAAGTPAYIAPEVLQGTHAAFANDIWSLGATVLELATHTPPYSGLRLEKFALLFHIGSRNPPLMEGLGIDGDEHRDLRDFLAQCFRIEPQLRPTASELLEHPFVGLRTPRTPAADAAASTAAAAASAATGATAAGMATASSDDADSEIRLERRPTEDEIEAERVAVR